MNREDILKRSQNEHKDEIIEYIDKKTTHYVFMMIAFIGLFFLMIGWSSPLRKEIYLTILCLFMNYLVVACFTRYYYWKKKTYLFIGLLVLGLGLTLFTQFFSMIMSY